MLPRPWHGSRWKRRRVSRTDSSQMVHRRNTVSGKCFRLRSSSLSYAVRVVPSEIMLGTGCASRDFIPLLSIKADLNVLIGRKPALCAYATPHGKSPTLRNPTPSGTLAHYRMRTLSSRGESNSFHHLPSRRVRPSALSLDFSCSTHLPLVVSHHFE